MKLPAYAMQPTGDGGSCALAHIGRTISPWARFDATTHAKVRLTGNGVVRPTDLQEGLTV